MMHEEQAPQSGKCFKVNVHHNFDDGPREHEFHVEDWWDRLTGTSWKQADGNPGAMWYAMRTANPELNIGFDDEVLYGHLKSPGGLGMLIHVSELGEEVQ